jgi:tRNA nucleotidyltransferase (CCA-adding enzyme)
MSTASAPESLLRVIIPQPVLAVVSRLREKGFQAFLVGGCVRDMLRGEEPKDYDVATDAVPDDVERLFPKVIPTGKQHGTVTVLMQRKPVEVTTFRTEGTYLDGRRPSSVEFHSSIEDDLSRRDFTINAMAYEPIQQELRDPFGGRGDLAAGLVRCVGDPDSRFREDGLRSLRAVRFAAVLGYSIDPTTAAAIPRSLPTFRKIAVERVRDEFCKLLVSPRPLLGLNLLRSTGLLDVFLPELLEGVGQAQSAADAHDVYGHVLATVELVPPDLTLRLAALLHDVAKPATAVWNPTGNRFDFPEHEILGAKRATEILERLKFPRKVIESVAELVRHHRLHRLPGAPDQEIRRFVAGIGEENLAAHLTLAEANWSAHGQDVDAALRTLSQLRVRIQKILATRPPLDARALALDGNEIMRVLGIGPSTAVGEATRFLLDQVLENPDINSPENLAALLRKWAQSRAG